MKTILLTFDVEDWFQVENFKGNISFSSWNNQELRVEKNVHKILDLLDSFDFEPKATFFTLGWIAKKLPHLVREISRRGHEIASHGSNHNLCTNQAPKELEKDLKDGKSLLEDISGHSIYGYRAPSFAINDDILKIIQKTGHLYDSSYNSFSMHGRYGKITLPPSIKPKSIYELTNCFYEIPVTNLTVLGKIFPLGGGGYFRLLPLPFFLFCMNQVLKHDDVFTFYSHPWEFDPDQPKVTQAPKSFKFRHYINQSKTEERLYTLIKHFECFRFLSCKSYIDATH